MVHALREAWRVLIPDAALIDLRPAIRHAWVGLIRDGQFDGIGQTHEALEWYREASRALQQAKQEQWFRQRSSIHFPCRMQFPSLDSLREWLDDWYGGDTLGRVNPLVARVERALISAHSHAAIGAEVRFILRLLEKRSDPVR